MAWRKRDRTPAGSETRNRTRSEFYISIPTPHGGRVQRSARTNNRADARAYEVMLKQIGPHGTRQFDILELIIAGSLPLAQAYEAWLADRSMSTLRVDPTTADTDVEPFVDRWRRARRDHLNTVTLASYTAAVRLLIPEGRPFLLSQLNRRVLSEWLGHMTGSAGARHYRLSAMRNFLAYLIELQILADNPADGLRRPTLPEPRCLHLEPRDTERLAACMPSPHREFAILLAGTGADVSSALTICVGDVDVAAREILVHGTKTKSRVRTVRVAEWAWPTVEALLTPLAGDVHARLFDPAVINRFNHWHAHRRAVKKLVAQGLKQFAGYTPRDSRHSFAVRLVRIGVPLHIVAQQLGHKDAAMVARIYGRFEPKQTERNQWEMVAAANDA